MILINNLEVKIYHFSENVLAVKSFSKYLICFSSRGKGPSIQKIEPFEKFAEKSLTYLKTGVESEFIISTSLSWKEKFY